ncbi:MAG: CvpA family protein [Gammaproteobacteria bacterium]
MNWVDYAILVIMALSAIISIWRGFMREVLSLLGWIVAFWVALGFGDVVADRLVNHIETPSVRLGAAFALLFVATLMVAGLVNFLIGRLIASTGLTGTDRMLGIFFGLARGIAIVTALVLAAGLTPLPKDPWWSESLFVGHFQDLAVWIKEMLPENFAQHITFGEEASDAEGAIANPPADSATN